MRNTDSQQSRHNTLVVAGISGLARAFLWAWWRLYPALQEHLPTAFDSSTAITILTALPFTPHAYVYDYVLAGIAFVAAYGYVKERQTDEPRSAIDKALKVLLVLTPFPVSFLIMYFVARDAWMSQILPRFALVTYTLSVAALLAFSAKNQLSTAFKSACRTP